MDTYPLAVVDDFFNDPNKIRNYGLSLDFHRDPKNNWPGLRTRFLSEINHNFYSKVNNKIISLYMEDIEDRPYSYSASMQFQLIPAGENYNGWIHADSPAVMTAIIYLTPSAGFDNGTSLFKLKDTCIGYNQDWNNNKDFSKDKDTIEEDRLKNNDQFIETARVGGFYNRLITFDSGEFHSANDISMDNKEDRLTLIVFFHFIEGIKVNPVTRVKRIKL
jgi:hypothetical protein